MAVVTFLGVDQSPEALGSWQLCKKLAAGQTAVTAALLSKSLRDVSFVAPFQVIPVSRYGKIRIQLWGTTVDNDSVTVLLYGWSENGPGAHFAKLTVTFANFTSVADTGFHTNAHNSITEEFLKGTAYRGCDTYVATNDYENILTVYTGEGDFPGHALVDFTNSQYKYFGMTASAITSGVIGAIFKPISLKKTNPQRVI